MITQNLHTHSTFCDGKDTLEEMIEAALQKGLTSLGFSSHAYTGFEQDNCGMSRQATDLYFEELDNLKQKYEGRIAIYKGLEMESRTIDGPVTGLDSRLDYAIGSCHIFYTPCGMFPVDFSPVKFQEAVEATPQGVKDLLEGYFEEVCEFAERSPFDIIGHFDLVTKYLEKQQLFDDNQPWYRSMALHYLKRAVRTGKIFEINTGAIGRGWRSTPYPSVFLLEELIKQKAPLTITSDCHNKKMLTVHFDESEKMLRSLGCDRIMELTPRGFKPRRI